MIIYKRHHRLKAIYEKFGTKLTPTRELLPLAENWSSLESMYIHGIMDTRYWTPKIDPSAYGGQKNSAYWYVTTKGMFFLVKYMGVELRPGDSIYMAKELLMNVSDHAFFSRGYHWNS